MNRLNFIKIICNAVAAVAVGAGLSPTGSMWDGIEIQYGTEPKGARDWQQVTVIKWRNGREVARRDKSYAHWRNGVFVPRSRSWLAERQVKIAVEEMEHIT